MTGQRNNCEPARGISTGKMTAAAWARFDALPRELRVALWESPVPINPASIADALGYASAEHVKRRIRDSVLDELGAFARQHRQRYGYDLPHVAANATLLRYEQRSAAQAVIQSFWRLRGLRL